MKTEKYKKNKKLNIIPNAFFLTQIRASVSKNNNTCVIIEHYISFYHSYLSSFTK